ncbi:hypothetical protein MKX01_040341 [Papaver californicum]|nr:hypothetical protein MKX01_040341 [Papaver californicum]
MPMSSSRTSSDSLSLGSFANLKLTAEKLVKEQASVKTDLDMANSKLKKAVGHIHLLEEKLQNAVNENAKLQVKQKEEAKLWKGLESKFSSTKTLCDQLTETLQYLAGQIRDAKHDKKVFEDKFSASSEAFDSLQLQMTGLTLKIGSTEQSMRNGYIDEKCRTVNLIGEKDAQIKDLEGAVVADKLCLQNINSQLEEVQHELRLKVDMCKCLTDAQNNLEREKSALHCNTEDLARQLVASGLEIKKLVELDRQSAIVSEHFVQLNNEFDTCYKLVQQEKDLTANRSEFQFHKLHDQLVRTKSENTHKHLMVQHAEENRLVEEKIRKMETEAEAIILKKAESEKLLTAMEEKIKQLSERSEASKNKRRDLLQKISTLESDNQDIQGKLQAKLQSKTEETEGIQKEIVEHEQHVASLETQIRELCGSLEEKEQLHQQYMEKEKLLEDQNAEIQASLAAAGNTLEEIKKQYDLMLESKQLELSKHLKEISQRNDQAINDIRRKFELEKLEIVSQEKQKVDKLVREMESQCDRKLSQSKEESRQSLKRVQEEHASLVSRLKQEYDKKERDVRDDNQEELKHVQLQAEDELQEKTRTLREEYDLQMKVLKCQHEDECKKMQEELGLQKSKRQRALLQMQWKVMDGNPKEDQEVTSTKDPIKYKRIATLKTRASKDAVKENEVYKGGNLSHLTRPSNIGDLFSEGSLNPYTDDPYVFD